MAISTPFSSQNTTIEIFNSSAATATLTTAIAAALAGSNKQADLKTAVSLKRCFVECCLKQLLVKLLGFELLFALLKFPY
jgi:hypothetical protein